MAETIYCCKSNSVMPTPNTFAILASVERDRFSHWPFLYLFIWRGDFSILSASSFMLICCSLQSRQRFSANMY